MDLIKKIWIRDIYFILLRFICVRLSFIFRKSFRNVLSLINRYGVLFKKNRDFTTQRNENNLYIFLNQDQRKINVAKNITN